MWGIIFYDKSNKELSLKSKKVKVIGSMKQVAISLSNNKGAPASCCIKPGTKVKAGSLIGKKNGNVSANVFSSVSGKVIKLEKRLNEDGIEAEYVVIESDGKNEIKYLPEMKNFSPKSVVKRIEDAGIVGLGGAKYPTHLKFNLEDEYNTLILNGAESDDYLTCDDILMQTKAKEIIEAGKICASVLNLKSFIIGVEKNKKDAIKALEHHAEKLKDIKCIVKVIPQKYPNGYEKALIKKCINLNVPADVYPSSYGIVVINVATAYAIYEAVKLNKPYFERVVTVAGRAVKQPGNYWIKNGTSYEDVKNFCGGEIFNNCRLDEYNILIENKLKKLEEEGKVLKQAQDKLKDSDSATYKKNLLHLKLLKQQYKEKSKNCYNEIKLFGSKIKQEHSNLLRQVVYGGSMMGKTISSKNITVNKATAGILFLTKDELFVRNTTDCINCGKCVKVCPVKIPPVLIERNYLDGKINMCKKLKALHCIECGCCSYVCPSERYIHENIQKAKREIKEGNNAI